MVKYSTVKELTDGASLKAVTRVTKREIDSVTNTFIENTIAAVNVVALSTVKIPTRQSYKISHDRSTNMLLPPNVYPSILSVSIF